MKLVKLEKNGHQIQIPESKANNFRLMGYKEIEPAKPEPKPAVQAKRGRKKAGGENESDQQ